jgi:bifunctional polynucleotide phosphatase/kinase
MMTSASAVQASSSSSTGGVPCVDANAQPIPDSSNIPNSNGWKQLDTGSIAFKFASNFPTSCTSLIAFDIDGTIITTKSGKTFAQNPSDWKFLYDSIPKKLEEHYNNGAYLAFITNQNGVQKGHLTLNELVTKMQSILSKINAPIDIICSLEDDYYRKPATGSLDFILQHRFHSTYKLVHGTIPMMYVGDAAGRPKTAMTPKDFSASDYKFALNAGINVSVHDVT